MRLNVNRFFFLPDGVNRGCRRPDWRAIYEQFYRDLLPSISAADLELRVNEAVESESLLRKRAEEEIRVRSPELTDSEVVELVEKSWHLEWETFAGAEIQRAARELIEGQQDGNKLDLELANLREQCANNPEALKWIKYLNERRGQKTWDGDDLSFK
ncbi:MAG TPA: hypothetical protein VG269_29385 [Tepidisphaeraceae bacterium]|nr:hypothetical protein [Tepidisphaeraceae bacterium]